MFDGQCPSAHFVPHGVDPVGRWTNEAHSGILHASRKTGILGKKSISRMNPVGAGFAQNFEQNILIEITVFGGRCSDGIGFICFRQIVRSSICL